MGPRGAALPVPQPDLTLTLGGLYARDERADRGEPAGRQRLHPLRGEVSAASLHGLTGEAAPPCQGSLPAPTLAAFAQGDPAVTQEVVRWIRHGNVAPAVAEQVLAAMMACRNDPNGRLDLRGLGLPENDPLPDLSILVPHAAEIDLAHTGLVAFPRSLLRLRALTDLALNDNAIAWLPEEIGAMVRLETLELQYNALTELPAGICRCRLRALDVSKCQLVALPAAMGEMQDLRYLWIGGNPDLAVLPDSLANLHADCEIHVNRAQPFRPQDLPRLADEVFAGGTDAEMSTDSSVETGSDTGSASDTDTASDADSGHLAEVPSLAAAVAAWCPALSSPGRGEPSATWAGFAAEANASSFAAWLHQLPACVGGDACEVASGMSELLLRMQHQPEFRRQCFVLAADALGACEDRVAMGFCHMQAALLTSRAVAKELSPAQLMDASRRLFNREALREFALAHAARAGIAGEALEVVLALEIRLRDRLALPQGMPGMLNEDFVQTQCELTESVVKAALAHVHDRQRAPGAGGLKEFLAGQGRTGFTAWIDHLRRCSGGDLDAVNRRAQARLEMRAQALGGTPDAYAQAGVEGKDLYNREFADVVWRLTQASLPVAGAAGAQAGGVPPDGAGSSSLAADREAAFHAASASLRARQRLQRGDEWREDGSQPPSPPRRAR